jgi:hypothetical protein
MFEKMQQFGLNGRIGFSPMRSSTASLATSLQLTSRSCLFIREFSGVSPTSSLSTLQPAKLWSRRILRIS